MITVCLAGPKKAKCNPRDPPGSGEELRQQNSIPANVSRLNLGNHPSAVKKKFSTASDMQMLPSTGTRFQETWATSLNAAASTATMSSNQSRETVVDSSPDGGQKMNNSHSLINQKIRLDPASTSASPESRTQRLKKRVLTGGQATPVTPSSAACDQPHKGFSGYSPGSRPPIHLSPHLDRLGTVSSFLCVSEFAFFTRMSWISDLFVWSRPQLHDHQTRSVQPLLVLAWRWV